MISATEVEPLSLNETVRQADAIVVGTVTAQNSRWGDDSKRWMVTDYTISIEEALYSAQGAKGVAGNILISYWGGTIGGKTQTISDLRNPRINERLVLMLKPGWREAKGFTPVVGFNQGLFSVSADGFVQEDSGQALALGEKGQVLRVRDQGATAKAKAAKVDLATFGQWVRSNAATIKSQPSELPRSQVNPSDPRIMKTFSNTPEKTGMPGPQAPLKTQNPAKQKDGAPASPVAPDTNSAPVPAGADEPIQRQQKPHPEYSFNHEAHLPIVMNQFPSSFAPWSPEDQYQMNKWNYYASDVFHVYTTPTGTYGWGNGRFDLAGWPSSADLQSIYGQPWDSGTRAITFLSYDGGGWIVEADVALNPAYSWTLDDEWVYNGGAAKSFHRSMTHELGHVTGLEHQFNYLSVMNYQQDVFRFFGLPCMDDAEGVRAEYPGNVVARNDLGVYLYYADSYQSYSDASYPSTVESGNTLTVNDFTIENVGTTVIATPTIEWYLTSARNFSSSYYYLGTSTHSSLNRFSYFTPSSVSRSFVVPVTVPPGNYYLSAFVRSDNSSTESSFPFDNNRAFSRSQITVTGPTALLNDTPVAYADVPKRFSFNIYSFDWAAVGIAPSTDHDIKADDDPAFGSPYAYSTYGGTVRDFIVVNGHNTGAATHYAQVSYGTPSTYTIEGEWDIPDLSPDYTQFANMSSAEVLDVYEVYLPAGRQYQCALDVSLGNADLGLYIFKPSQTYGSRSSAAWTANNTSSGGNESVVLRTDTSAEYGIVVVNENGGSANYSIVVRTPPAPHLTVPILSGGIFRFAVSGTPGAIYVLQRSSDLVTWSNFGTVTIPPSGTVTISDPVGAGAPLMFYRVVLL